jgi:hypothetical protein
MNRAAALLVDPENISHLAEQLNRVAMDPMLRNDLRAAGLLQAKGFEWNQTASETLKV